MKADTKILIITVIFAMIAAAVGWITKVEALLTLIFIAVVKILIILYEISNKINNNKKKEK
jgi:hypothetical protein